MGNKNNNMKVGMVELRMQVIGLQQTIEELIRRGISDES
ncbi:Phage protein [Bacillus thuringiensis YBT-1518]|uniref:Phage protein n=1 Tax=Bacillus thuringiensis YBT-1518 TaxID=529122 RepID=A0A9W3PIQ6_BACTU|nr:Phage protein [Bacillus thuringiensis YBT-1518]